ncbi:MAG: glucose-1-phosphate cytidylyltransferase [Spirochaetia bacterium]|nr:glucose-1-phosphate cytidylyltransferase [Spirochaetia bacterium]
MKAVILAGGMGTRISEETQLRPKPMIEIGGKPIIWHILKIYSAHGVKDFIICLGYKGYLIKEYFANYFLHVSDVTFDMEQNKMEVHERHAEPWKITLIDTGENTMTGGRLKRVMPYLEKEESFFFTYGDGVGNIDITASLAFHRKQKTLATVTAVQPPGRWGTIEIEDDKVLSFKEKPLGDGGWINGGFFILSPKVVKYIPNDESVWEQGPLEKLASEKQLSVFKHNDFWQPMDTLRDKMKLESLWGSDRAPWKMW